MSSSGGSVRLSVADRGLGIPAGEQRRIFEKFYRLDPNMTRGIGGTGLGLYISSELVRRFDGRIWVDSREGRGLDVPRRAAGGGGFGAAAGGDGLVLVGGTRPQRAGGRTRTGGLLIYKSRCSTN